MYKIFHGGNIRMLTITHSSTFVFATCNALCLHTVTLLSFARRHSRERADIPAYYISEQRRLRKVRGDENAILFTYNY